MSEQLRLFHRGTRESHIEMRKTCPGSYGFVHYRWLCTRCGRGGTHYSTPRYDLLEWALKNHKCRPVWEDECAS